MRRDVFGVKLNIQVKSLVDLMTEIGIGPAERKHHADLDCLSLGNPAHREGQGGYSEPAKLAHLILLQTWNSLESH